MSPVIGLSILVGLVIAFVLARRAARLRKQRREQRRRARLAVRKPKPTSARAEMRAYEDPTTFADDTTTRGRTDQTKP